MVLLELETLPKVDSFSTEGLLLATGSSGDGSAFLLIGFGFVLTLSLVWLTMRFILNVVFLTLLVDGGGGGDVMSTPLRRNKMVAPFSMSGAKMAVA